MSTKQTAKELYDQRRADIARVMDWLELELQKHQDSFAAEPQNGCFAGDLGHVREKVIETLAFLCNFEPSDIEEALDEARADTVEAMKLNFKVEQWITTDSAVLERLATRLDDFSEIDPALTPLNGTGGRVGCSIVTDGRDAVLVNAEGYNYPRYRSPRIRLHLLPELNEDLVDKLCIRKSCWHTNLVIDNRQQLQAVAFCPYRHVQ